MTKRPKSGRCVHCLQNVEDLTRDHIFPFAWYPDNTPENLQRWTIPSCKKCNEEYGRLEEDLLLRLGMCIDPEDAKSSGITDKVLRSIDPDYANDRTEKRIRERKREKIKKEIVRWQAMPTIGFHPNFRVESNVYYPEYPSIPISVEKLERLCHKIVRGITYFVDQTFIESNFEIQFFTVDDKAAQPILEKYQQYLETYDRPGIKVIRAMTSDNPDAGFYAIEIWGRLKMYAVVKPNKLSC
ncbi:HNH endonuclease [Nostoc sp. PCC 9305]|uniref:HNH endonuclease n=1 Tax=Nostoc sp. PCC 9305 TaxID=296636 RepID=UPI0039C66082